jgi:tetratricopeptide (TPR) repeat protein
MSVEPSPAPSAGLVHVDGSGSAEEDLDEMRDRALAHQRAGRWTDAATTYSAIFPRALAAGDVGALARALYGQARARRGQRRYEEALELVELCREVCHRNGMVQLAARALNESAVQFYERGDLDGARARYEKALEEAWIADDAQLMAFIYQNLGVIANTRGDLREARVLYLESIAASLRCQDPTSAVMVYNNLGMLSADLQEWMESEVFFDRGIEIAEREGHREQVARLYVNRAEPLIEMEEFGLALASLEHAEGIAVEIGNRSALANIARFRARISRRCGDLPEAERYANQSISIAEDARLELLRAEALEELAKVRWEEGRRAEACEAMAAAVEIFTATTAANDAVRAAEVLARWRATPP